MSKTKMVMIVTIVTITASGCGTDANVRLANQAERNLERQSEQALRNAEIHRQVAEGTNRLVHADAAARKTIVDLHRDIQSERAKLSDRLDQFDAERRDFWIHQNRESLIANAISLGLPFVACAVPLLIAWRVLRTDDNRHPDAIVLNWAVSEIGSRLPEAVLSPGRLDRDSRDQPPRLQASPGATNH